MNKFIEKRITSLYHCCITFFYESKIRAMKPFKCLLCRGADKNSELSQASKMELLEKIVKVFKEVPRKLTCGNNFCKVAASKALISM